VLTSSKHKFVPGIQINQSTRCKGLTTLLLDAYVWLNMFRAPLRLSSGAYNCTRSLWFYRWSVAVGAFVGRGLAGRADLPDNDQKRSNRHAPTIKPEAPSAVVRSWWWAKRRPKYVEPHVTHLCFLRHLFLNWRKVDRSRFPKFSSACVLHFLRVGFTECREHSLHHAPLYKFTTVSEEPCPQK